MIRRCWRAIAQTTPMPMENLVSEDKHLEYLTRSRRLDHRPLPGISSNGHYKSPPFALRGGYQNLEVPMPMFVNRTLEPVYAGLGTFCKVPLALEEGDLDNVDVAILGAPFDVAVTNRPGTRLGPRAIRQADTIPTAPPVRPHMGAGVDPFEVLRVVDYGDIESVAADTAEADALIQEHVGQILRAGAIPVVLGGDHSIAYSTLTAAGKHFGADVLGVVQFDTHADTGDERGKLTHGTPMRMVIEESSVRGDRFLQFGLRGYWPAPADFEWMRSAGMRWQTMYDIEERGVRSAVDELVLQASALEGRVYLSIDVDVLDPAFAPGTGTPEPGGLTTRELLYAVRRLCSKVDVAGIEVVEVSPPYDHSGITAMAAHRCILEALSGIASQLPTAPAERSQVAPG